MPFDLACRSRRLGRQMLRLLLCWAAMSAGTSTWAQPSPSSLTETLPAASNTPHRATPLAADPILEEQVMQIAHELRCLVCQNETIAASHAELAQDLRKQIRLKLQQGQSPSEIMDFMVTRYGDFIRYRPALKGTTLLLWIGPFALLLAALAGLLYMIKQRRNTPQTPLSDEQRTRAKTLLTPPQPPTSL